MVIVRDSGNGAGDPVRKSPVNEVGVLALQGDFALHAASLGRVGRTAREVRTPGELAGLSGLILPGGESTTMRKLMERTGMDRAVLEFHRKGRAVFGTCAGLILLARGVTGPEQGSLGMLDADVARNAYGRQIDSFETDLPWSEDREPVRGVFIRAPRITRLGDGVRVLASLNGDPVLVRGGNILAATFHPELTDDSRLHRYFLEEMLGKNTPEDLVVKKT
jgi:5'-phosphate synthase pdxT subunit